MRSSYSSRLATISVSNETFIKELMQSETFSPEVASRVSGKILEYLHYLACRGASEKNLSQNGSNCIIIMHALSRRAGILDSPFEAEPALNILLEVIHSEGMDRVYSISESEQESVNRTCRGLFRWLENTS